MTKPRTNKRSGAKPRSKLVSAGLPVFDPNPSGRFAAGILAATGVEGALVGRVAVWAWLPDASDHAYTKDVDVALSAAGLLKVCAYLAARGVETHALPIGGVNAVAAGGVNVDFITRTGELGDLGPLFEDAVHVAGQNGKCVTVGGKDLLLVPLEHLVAMKIATMERKDEEDAQRLLNAANVNVDKLRILVTKFLGPLGPSRLEVVLREIGHPAARPRRKFNASPK
jgi:hypothetical protein